MPPRLKAFLLLASTLVRTLIRRLLGQGRRGLAAFRENYAADGLAPLSVEDRADLPTMSGCIACGVCDRGESARIAASNGAYPGVMALILAGSRSMPDFAAAAIGFAHVPDAILAEKETRCPTGVPMRRIARFVREKAGEARVSLPAVASARALPSGHGGARS